MKISRPVLFAVGLFSALCLCILCLILVGFTLTINVAQNRNPTSQKEMLQLTLAWARLEPLPPHADNLSVSTEGSAMTRSFRVSFSAPQDEIDAWLQQSPGTSSTFAQILDADRLKYTIEPGGGASRAEVIVDTKNHTVEIYVSWS